MVFHGIICCKYGMSIFIVRMSVKEHIFEIKCVSLKIRYLETLFPGDLIHRSYFNCKTRHKSAFRKNFQPHRISEPCDAMNESRMLGMTYLEVHDDAQNRHYFVSLETSTLVVIFRFQNEFPATGGSVQRVSRHGQKVQKQLRMPNVNHG